MDEKRNKQPRFMSHSVMIYLNELSSRVVAQTGIPTDMYHVGKCILQSMKEAPDLVLQIDGASNQLETNRSVLERSMRCAEALKKLGLESGDVMMLMAPNHLDVTIAIYGAIFSGVICAPVDMNLKVQELQNSLTTIKPKLIFCQNDKVPEIVEALRESNTDAHIITFDEGRNLSEQNFKQFLGEEDVSIENFKVADLNPEEAIIYLTSTSGSTGLPKSVALTHKNVYINFLHFFSVFYDFSEPELFMIISPVQWLSALLHYTMAPLLRYTRLQSSATANVEHIYDIINKYKPTSTLMSSNLMSTLLIQNTSGLCDFSCFKNILIGGSPVHQATLDVLKIASPNTNIDVLYGISECAGLLTECDDCAPVGSIGRPLGNSRHRLVDPNTMEDIYEPFVTGELWVKGPCVFKGYYNDPESTKAVFAEDDWFRTGDLMYRDKNNYYFYVDRCKLMLKYKAYQVSPHEIELVIRKHPGVADVVVVGIQDVESGDLPVACVVRHTGCDVTAQEIKDIVKENLSDSKQLRGGVIFLDSIPMGSTTKCDRVKLKSMVALMERE